MEVRTLCEGTAVLPYTYIAYVIILKIIMNVHQQVNYVRKTIVTLLVKRLMQRPIISNHIVVNV